MTKQILDYANARSARLLTMRGLHFARWAAIIPLVAGTAITGLFVLTRVSVLPWLGLLCIGLGGLSVLAAPPCKAVELSKRVFPTGQAHGDFQNSARGGRPHIRSDSWKGYVGRCFRCSARYCSQASSGTS